MDKKADLRRAMRAVLSSMPAAGRKRASQRAADCLLSLPMAADASCVFAFVGVGDEIDTAAVITRLLAEGRRVCVPYIGSREAMRAGRMQAVELSSLGDCVPAPFGLLEPPRADRAVRPDDIDCVLTPGLAFDRRGARLGQGGGFYDRFLAAEALRTVPTVGYGFAQQIVDEVPCEEHDIRLDAVVTDSGALDLST